jgi:hypothetical protein
MRFGHWRTMTDWTRFCSVLPTRHQLDVWEQWPDAGICVACGMNGLIAVDIDLEQPSIVQAIESVLPPSLVAKKGAKGKTLFYRGDTSKIRSRPYDVRDERAVDLLASGRQTVVPPTMHPAGMPYEWITTDTLLTVPVNDLPVVPNDIASQLEEVLAPFGYVEPPAPRAAGAGAGDSIWSALNGAALERLQDWVPMLGLPGTRRHGRGFRAVPVWRPSSTGRPTSARNPNLSFDPRGIKDMGKDVGMTPVDVVEEALGLDFVPAAHWLADKIGHRIGGLPDPGGFDHEAFIARSLAAQEGKRKRKRGERT